MDTVYDNYANLAGRLGKTVQEVLTETEATMRATLNAGTLATRRSINSTERILTEGRFKSQFETQTSAGMLSPKTRADAENKMFGYREDLNARDRPIYGYLEPPAGQPRPNWSGEESYGDVKFTLKDSVRDRTSATWDDSLFSQTRPSAITEPRASSYNPGYTFGDTRLKPGQLGYPYTELQFHKGLTVDDIASITLKTQQEVERLRKLLESRGFTEDPRNPLRWLAG
jgi:hypothetical protein